ncbi:MAG: hypothetical protein ACTSQM_05130, partial [Candidatus Odinarchaeia archaeon]
TVELYLARACSVLEQAGWKKEGKDIKNLKTFNKFKEGKNEKVYFQTCGARRHTSWKNIVNIQIHG